LRSLLRSFGFAFGGVRLVWRSERNFRIEVFVALLAVTAAVWLGVNPTPILLVIALVLALELMNSAIEYVVDLVSPDVHPLAGAAKDCAAAAVLVASVVSVAVGVVTLGPPLWLRLSSLAGGL
jgi:diacylglycerol kinase (ATP)